MSHLNNKKKWCHAWDIEEEEFLTWKRGEKPLSANAVLLPNGEHPKIPSQVVCGTCGEHRLSPKLMKEQLLVGGKLTPMPKTLDTQGKSRP